MEDEEQEEEWVQSMTTLVEATKRTFGDRADGLLDGGLIMPVTERKTPAMAGSWKDYTDPSQFKGQNHYGYAIKTGEASGLTAVDFDGLVVPSDFNTKTRRGFHAWVPYESGDTNRKDINGSKVDIRGEGGYIVFASPTHSVVRTGLLSRDEFLEWLRPVRLEGNYEPVSPHQYVADVAAYGYTIDLEWVSKRLAGQLQGTVEGSRNGMLYVSAAQVIHLGGTEEQIKRVVDAAYASGLESAEIHKTMASARNAEKVVPHFYTALRWANQARETVDSPVVDHIVRCVAEQHNMSPLVSQAQIANETGKERKTVRRHLNRLIKDGHLAEKVQEGRRANGLKHCNNFTLLGAQHEMGGTR